MNVNFLPFALPDIGEEEIEEVVDCLRSGWITTGLRCKKFESAFCDFLGGGVECVAVNSATAALHLGLEALKVGIDEEVITTVHTFTATAEIIRYLGANPIFVDISEDTLCINPSLIEEALTPRTRAIIPVHFGGRAADMDFIHNIAHRHSVSVIEDAAHALPTTYNNKMIGSLNSDVTAFSFYANKTITTGEGGMLVTRNPVIANRARIMRLHGINRDAFDRSILKKPSWYYEVVAPGFKYNMTDIAASMGIHQLRKAYIFQKKRKEVAKIYDDAFKELPIILPPQALPNDTHSWHLYAIRLNDDVKISRNMFIDSMFEQGIGCSVHYIPLHLQPYWRDTYKLTPEMFPISQRVYERTVCLPIYSSMSMVDIERVIAAVKISLSK